MFNLSVPSPENAPRLESLGPHFKKIFFHDRWEPIHLLIAPDTGPPHDHAYDMKQTKIISRGYRENVWVLTEGGGYTLHLNVERRPGTMHDIHAETIHLITGLLDGEGPSVSQPDPGVAGRVWFHYLPQPDGSVQRGPNWDGPWEDYHPAGPVHVIDHAVLNGGLEAQGVARFAPVVAAGVERTQEEIIQEFIDTPSTIYWDKVGFVIGPNNSFQQAWEAMQGGHRARRPHMFEGRAIIFDGIANIFRDVRGESLAEWLDGARNWNATGADVAALDWEVLPDVQIEKPTV